MDKKIWTLEKLQRMIHMLMKDDVHGGNARQQTVSNRTGEDNNLFQLLQNEKLNGPSDRDPTVASRELIHFKGPYIYVYDIDEKQKPVMVREYSKVANKHEGEWPQFRSVANGRCPFVEEVEPVNKENRRQQADAKEKEKAVKPVVESSTTLKPPAIPPPRPVTGKRTLSEMEDGHNRVQPGVRPAEIFDPAQAFKSKPVSFPAQNAFTSRAAAGRQFGGEPVASGVQPSGITSAIRSNMISSTSGINGAKAGTSKEVHGLQRKVLQKSASTSHDLSSRRLAEMSVEGPSSRSMSLSRTNSRKLEMIDESAETREGKEQIPTAHARTQAPPAKSKKDLKPGYCENCQDKFRDFDEVCRLVLGNFVFWLTGLTAYFLSEASKVCREQRELVRTRLSPGAAETYAQVPGSR
jgi:regulatory subunit for Cdc7p protein kinase